MEAGREIYVQPVGSRGAPEDAVELVFSVHIPYTAHRLLVASLFNLILFSGVNDNKRRRWTPHQPVAVHVGY